MDWSYSDRPYRLRRTLDSSTRRLISTLRSAVSKTVAPTYTHLGDLLVYPAGCLSNENDFVLAFRHRHMITVLASETVDPKQVHTATITVIIFARLFLDLEKMLVSSE